METYFQNLPPVEKVEPTPYDRLLQLAVMRIEREYKPGWLYYRCQELGLLEQYATLKKRGVFQILEHGSKTNSSSFESPKLSIELVPSTCWFSNVRSHVADEDWQTIKRKTFKRAGYKCEICGSRGPKWPAECHEIWKYDDNTSVQTLEGFIALCPSCHKVKHIGRARLQGKSVETTAHLAIVNGWAYLTAEKYVDKQFAVWRERSQHGWQLNISFIEKYGISVNNGKQITDEESWQREDSYLSAGEEEEIYPEKARKSHQSFWCQIKDFFSHLKRI